jgi:hypothetical protein
MVELKIGLIIRHSPGHTLGLSILQVNVKNSGTWIVNIDPLQVSGHRRIVHGGSRILVAVKPDDELGTGFYGC